MPKSTPAQLESMRKYRAAHKDELREKRRLHRKRTQEYFFKLKGETPCADCGGHFHPVAMQWDHRPGEIKVEHVANLVKAGKPNMALAEIAKCDLVCANCHAVRTFERRQRFGEGSASSEFVRPEDD